jgi:hypothetical protein
VPGSPVSGALKLDRHLQKLYPVGGEKCSRCGRLSGCAGVNGGEYANGAEDEIDIGDGLM